LRKVRLDEVLDIAQYERVREAERARLIELKRPRRIGLGENLTLLFENHDTVLFQVQEMMRAERIVLPERIQDEIDTYNALVPDPGQLSGTLFIEIEGISAMTTAEMRTAVNRFRGIQDGHVSLVVGDLVRPLRDGRDLRGEARGRALPALRRHRRRAGRARRPRAGAAARLHPSAPPGRDGPRARDARGAPRRSRLNRSLADGEQRVHFADEATDPSRNRRRPNHQKHRVLPVRRPVRGGDEWRRRRGS
jgi:hypothetical protein